MVLSFTADHTDFKQFFFLVTSRFTWYYLPKSLRNGWNPFRAAVPFWGQTSQIRSSLPQKRDCGPKRVIKWVQHRHVYEYRRTEYTRKYVDVFTSCRGLTSPVVVICLLSFVFVICFSWFILASAKKTETSDVRFRYFLSWSSTKKNRYF